MSMNLECKEVELWQTPTHITYMCYFKWRNEKLIPFQNTGRIEQIQDNWISIRERYILWCEMYTQDYCNRLYSKTQTNIYGVLLTDEEITEIVSDMQQNLKEHITVLREFKILHFYIT